MSSVDVVEAIRDLAAAIREQTASAERIHGRLLEITEERHAGWIREGGWREAGERALRESGYSTPPISDPPPDGEPPRE